MVAELTPQEQRCQDPSFVAKLSFPALLAILPLSLPVPDDIPASPKRRYRSQYVYLGYQDLLADTSLWPILSPFDLALRLIDFSSLEGPLAEKVYAASAKGQVPFHPVSMFLLFSWQRLNKWKRTEALRNLANPFYTDFRQRFGFSKGIYPTEGGLRHFETRLGAKSASDLIAQTVELAQTAHCISNEASEHGILATDGMLHDAASRMRCRSVCEDCYKPAPRPCKAKDEKGRKGCDCDEIACAEVCKYATPRDPEARFIVYQGHNQTDSPNAPHQSFREGQSSLKKAKPPSGKPRYGYRSVCVRLIDPVLRTSWVLADELLSATAPEDQTATTLMKGVVSDYEWVKWQFAVADAGEGREPFLSTAYDLGLRRVVGLRATEGDGKAEAHALRGYDDKGIPLCQHGYRLHPNGWDSQRKRHKWCCRRTCEKEMERPAPDCPYRQNESEHGFVRDIGMAFGDGSTRLVRDVPYGSPLWDRLYGRGRNAAEERNSQFEKLGLKRMPVYGKPRVRATVTVVDMWVNLLTIVRLIREVVTAATGPSPPDENA